MAREKKQKRTDITGNEAPLTDNPFGGLAGLGVPEAEEPQAAPAPSPTAPSTEPFRITRTRKGGYPIAVEKRTKGKVVTVLRNISGDSAALLRQLKKTCGAGGQDLGDAIEIQGDHRAALEAFLKKNGC